MRTKMIASRHAQRYRCGQSRRSHVLLRYQCLALALVPRRDLAKDLAHNEGKQLLQGADGVLVLIVWQHAKLTQLHGIEICSENVAILHAELYGSSMSHSNGF